MSKPIGERTMQIILDSESGMTCRAIAEKHGVSHQRVQSVVGKYSPAHFRYLTESGCIYPNLRRWMNSNKVSRAEFLRRMGLEAYPENKRRLNAVMTGNYDVRRSFVDRMLRVTGMTYEEMFCLEVQDG